jgi:hypothetical protein
MTNWKRFSAQAVLVTMIGPGLTGSIPAAESGRANAGCLRETLLLHALFNQGPDADFGKENRRLSTAPSIQDRQTTTPNLPGSGLVSVVSGKGKLGDALRFHRTSPEIVFFQADDNLQSAGLLQSSE